MTTETNATHTPGPWTWAPTYHGGDGRTPTGFYINAATLMVITGEPAVAMSVSEMLANARLIAAAPRMWALLCLCMDDDDMREQYADEWQAIVNQVEP